MVVLSVVTSTKSLDGKFEKIESNMEKLETNFEKLETNCEMNSKSINELKSRLDTVGYSIGALVAISSISTGAIKILEYFHIGPNYI